MKYYYNPASSNSRKVTAVLEATGLEAERIVLDVFKGENQTPEFLAINPNAKIPALVDGETKLFESNAIMSYLASKAKSELWPPNNSRYDILKWMFWATAHFGPACDTIVRERVLKKLLNLGEPDAGIIAAGEKDLARFAAVLNGALEGNDFLVNGQLSIADISVASHLSYAEPAQLPLSEYKHLLAWKERMDNWQPWAKTAPQPA